MKTFNKLILTFLLMFAVNISAQGVFYLHGVRIPQKYQANFESNEKEFFSKLAQDYVNLVKCKVGFTKKSSRYWSCSRL